MSPIRMIVPALFLAGAGPALAQSGPLELACPADAGFLCGVGLVEEGGGGKVLVLQADQAGWIGRKITLTGEDVAFTVEEHAGKVLIFEYKGPPEQPSPVDAELGGVRLLYVLAPVAPAQMQ